MELKVLRLDVDFYGQWKYLDFWYDEVYTASCTIFNIWPQVRFA